MSPVTIHRTWVSLLTLQSLVSVTAWGTPKVEPISPLLLAVHLTRPEVIEKCLREIEKSDYEFVWKDIEEKKDPTKASDSAYKLTANLLKKSDLTKKASDAKDLIVGEATLTMQRDLKKFREQKELFFNCHIEYKMNPKN